MYNMDTSGWLVSWRTVGMAPKKNGGHIKSAQMTHSKCLRNYMHTTKLSSYMH